MRLEKAESSEESRPDIKNASSGPASRPDSVDSGFLSKRLFTVARPASAGFFMPWLVFVCSMTLVEQKDRLFAYLPPIVFLPFIISGLGTGHSRHARQRLLAPAIIVLSQRVFILQGARRHQILRYTGKEGLGNGEFYNL